MNSKHRQTLWWMGGILFLTAALLYDRQMYYVLGGSSLALSYVAQRKK